MLVLLAVFASGCASADNYQLAYRKAWKQIINSQAWQDALHKPEEAIATNDTVSPFLPELSWEGSAMEAAFRQRYPSLVYRAYFRIISQAEAADRRIRSEYQRLSLEARNTAASPASVEALGQAKNRYEAHREMLEGLKSWNAFNQYGTDDLEFFLKEYAAEAAVMHRRGLGEERIIGFLMVKLADLYHFEERERQN